MEVSYYKDSIKNYMVARCPEETEGYQYHMMEMNRIEGVLPCEVRYIDGNRLLYYEITGKQSLRSLFENRKISGAQFKNLLQAVDRISGVISEYLLDETQIVLSPDQIFLDMNTGQFLFTYFPGDEEPSTVFRFLADAVDMSDKDAAACVFRLCAMERDGKEALNRAVHEEINSGPAACSNGFVSSGQRETELCRNTDFGSEEFFKKDDESSAISGADTEKKIKEHDVNEEWKTDEKKILKGSRKKLKRNCRRKVKERSENTGNNPDNDGNTYNNSMSTIRKAARICLIALCIFGAAGLIAAQYYLFISEREARLCVAGAALLIAGGVLLTADFILRMRKENSERKAKEQAYAFVDSGEDNYEYGMGNLTQEDMKLHGNCEKNPDTVFLQAGEAAGRLYGTGNNRGSRIDLEVLPITIGKASEYADILLDDISVSRVHAKICRTERGEIIVKDLGSTNGTWIDGIRMNPNESRIIERGQEIRFGRIEYIYR